MTRKSLTFFWAFVVAGFAQVSIAQVPHQLQGIYKDVLKSFGEKNYQSVIEKCKRIINQEPDFQKAYNKLYLAAKSENILPDLKYYFTELAKQPQLAGFAHWGLAKIAEESKMFSDAIKHYKVSISSTPHLVTAYTDLTGLYLVHKKSELSDLREYYQSIVKEKPGIAEANFAMAHLIHNTYESKEDLKNSLQFTDKALQINPHLLEAYYIKGVTLYFLSEYNEALRIWQTGKALAAQLLDLEMHGKLVGRIGAVYGQQGEYFTAQKCFKEALGIAFQIGDKNEQLKQIGNLGVISRYLSKYDDALDYYDQTIKLAREVGDRKSLGIAHLSKGNIYSDTGNYYNAISCYHDSYYICQESGEKRTETIALVGLGSRYTDLGYYAMALEYLQKALELARQLGDRRSEGTALTNIGIIYADLNEFETGIDYFKQALNLAKELNARRSVVANLIDLGDTYFDIDDLFMSEKSYKEALGLAKELNEPRFEGYALVGLGDLQLANSDPPFNDFYKKSKELAIRIGEPKLEIISRMGLSSVLRKKGQYEEAIVEVRTAISILERTRDKLSTPSFRTGFLHDYPKVLESAVELFAEAYTITQNEDLLKEAFHIWEKGKARSLAEMVVESNLNLKPSIDSVLIKAEATLASQLVKLNKQISKVVSKREIDFRYLDSLKIEKGKIVDKFEDFLLRLRRADLHYADLKYPAAFAAKDVQAVLSAEQHLLEFLVGEKKTYLWHFTRDEFALHIIDLGRNELAEYLSEVSPFFPARKEGRELLTSKETLVITAPNYHTNSSKLYKLYKSLLQPVFGDQNSIPTQLIIVPDDLLFHFPFEMLVTDISDNTPRFLVEDVAITYSASSSLLNPALRKKRHPKKELFAIGNPDFGTEQDEGLATAFSQWFASIFRNNKWLPLLHAETEVKTLAENFKDNQVLTGKRATEAAFKRDAADYRYVHLATHYLVNDYKPMFSKLILARALDDTMQDGYLHTFEVFNLDLNAELITLSACNTALGPLRRGEGLMGMSRAFMYAGVPSLVVSLWPVEDETTAFLMSQFYKYLAAGEAKNVALQTAKIDLIKSDFEKNKPFYWAPFILIGDWK